MSCENEMNFNKYCQVFSNSGNFKQHFQTKFGPKIFKYK